MTRHGINLAEARHPCAVSVLSADPAARSVRCAIELTLHANLTDLCRESGRPAIAKDFSRLSQIDVDQPVDQGLFQFGAGGALDNQA